MTREDAELMYDGAIPKGTIAPSPYTPQTQKDIEAVERRISEAISEELKRVSGVDRVEARAVLDGWEHGRTMVSVRHGTWTQALSVNPASVARALNTLQQERDR